MMIDTVCKGYYTSLRQSPAEAPSYYRDKRLQERLLQLLLLLWISESRVVLFITWVLQSPSFESIVYDLPLFVKLFPVIYHILYQNLVLEFFDFIVRPEHGDITVVYYLEVRVPEGSFSFEHLIPDEGYQNQVFSIVVMLEDLLVLIYQKTYLRVSDSDLRDHDTLWNKQKCLLWRYICLSSHTNQLSIPAVSHRVVD